MRSRTAVAAAAVPLAVAVAWTQTPSEIHVDFQLVVLFVVGIFAFLSGFQRVRN